MNNLKEKPYIFKGKVKDLIKDIQKEIENRKNK